VLENPLNSAFHEVIKDRKLRKLLYLKERTKRFNEFITEMQDYQTDNVSFLWKKYAITREIKTKMNNNHFIFIFICIFIHVNLFCLAV